MDGGWRGASHQNDENPKKSLKGTSRAAPGNGCIRFGTLSASTRGMSAVVRTLSVRKLGGHTCTWTSLVAETAGLGPFSALTVVVRAAFDVPEGHRLVVLETTDGESRPIASAQRAVSGDALRRGLEVRMFRSAPSPSTRSRTRVVAWIEPGTADLDYGALEATPLCATWYGSSTATRDRVQLVLTPVPVANDVEPRAA